MAIHFESIVKEINYRLNYSSEPIIQIIFNDQSSLSVRIDKDYFGKRQVWDLNEILGEDGLIVGKQKNDTTFISESAKSLHIFTSGTLGKTPLTLVSVNSPSEN